MFKQICISLLIGFAATVAIMQFDPWVHTQLGQLYKNIFAYSFDCVVEGEFSSISIFFKPRLAFKDFKVSDPAGRWKWSVGTYTTGFSWLSLLMLGSIDLWVDAQGVGMDSDLHNNVPVILPHVQKLLKGPDLPLPFLLRSIRFDGNFTLKDQTGLARMECQGVTKAAAHGYKTSITVKDCNGIYNNICLFEKSVGNLQVTTHEGPNPLQELKVDMQCDIPQMPYKRALFSGVWYPRGGRFSLNTIDQLLRVSPLIITQRDNSYWVQLNAHVPLSYIESVLIAGLSESSLDGAVDIVCAGSFDGEFIDGSINAYDVQLPMIKNKNQFQSSFNKRGVQWYGTFDSLIADKLLTKGDWRWHTQQKIGSLYAKNVKDVVLFADPFGRIASNDLFFTMDFDSTQMHGTYGCTVSDSLKKKKRAISGTVSCSADKGIQIDGTSDLYCYSGTFDWTAPYIKNVLIQKGNLSHCAIHPDENGLEALIDLDLFRLVMRSCSGYDLQGEGTIALNGTLRNGVYSGSAQLRDGTIRLPHTYNFAHKWHAQVEADMRRRSLTLKDCMLGMHAGRMYCKEGVCTFGQDGAVAYAHIPLLFDHCLFNFKHDLFAMISGNLLYEQRANTSPTVRGVVILDRAQLKENIFSRVFQNKIFSMLSVAPDMRSVDILYDVRVDSKELLKIETEFLHASARVGLHCYGSVQEPTIEGAITLDSGVLHFPYKPLTIQKGIIQFNKQESLNPSIELLARNTIKKHLITLQVTGSVANNFVMLEATPALSEEQIVSLLVAGVEDESLSALVPTLLMRNVTNLVFSSDQSQILQQYIRPWMKQFKVQFLPSLSDQSGRGGLRGVLEVSVGDRWRALIKKNFTLTEDTQFELEYILSDDVQFRVIRDERCDIGGEVQMRWKF